MPIICKIDDFTESDTTKNKYGSFEKASFKKVLKLEDINKNGNVIINYDINNNPQLTISSCKETAKLTNNKLSVSEGNFDKINLNNKDLEKIIHDCYVKIKYLEDRVKQLENAKKICKHELDEYFNENLYLIEFENANIGLFSLFKLNDNKEYLYICYYVDKNVSYWKLVSDSQGN